MRDQKHPYRRKLIEVDLPLDVINAESGREKSLRHGHPSTLHLWWARRPLAACRAVLFASLVDDPVDCEEEFPTLEMQRAERARLHGLLRRLVVWENRNDVSLLSAARYEIARSIARSRDQPAPTEPADVLSYLAREGPPLYDPFCGGGSIPLEAQRLGLRAVGTDLNPVAVLITKGLIELPATCADRPPVHPEANSLSLTVGRGRHARHLPWQGASGLAADVRYYGRQMRERAWARIGRLYPPVLRPDGQEATVIAWLWARTVPCPNPACGVAIPLLTTFQVSKKKGNAHWLWPAVDRETKTVSFTVRGECPPVALVGVDGKGHARTRTVTRNGAICLACSGAVPLAYVREQARAGHMGEVMTCIVAEGDRKRLFLSPTDGHRYTAHSAQPPPEAVPPQKMPTTAYKVSGRGYGITHWHQLFMTRQLVALTTFSALLADIKIQLEQDGAEANYARAVCTYLAFAIGRVADSSSRFATWQNVGDFVAHVFVRQAIPMVWDFAEANPFSRSTQNWLAQVEWIAKVVEASPRHVHPGTAYQADAATTHHAAHSPVIVTDPPYYDNISYAELSDFFYVWLRPLLREHYPDLLAGIRVPTQEEMIAAPRFENADERFERLMGQTLRLLRQRCNPAFPSSIFYAYKQQEQERDGIASTGWETMLAALVKAGFQIVGTWPMRTERAGRSNALAANALASSVVLVCRPRPDDAPVASRREFLTALGRDMRPHLDRLTQASHMAPVDLRQAAIGLGMAVYSRYPQVETLAGTPVTVRQALMAINDAVDTYLREQAGDLDAASRFCLDWLQTYPSGQGDYGTAETLARTYDLAIDDHLVQTHRLLQASQGQVTLYDINAYDAARPYPRAALTAWEGCLRMAYHMQTGEERQGVTGCADVARHAGDRLDSVERLARILYDHYNNHHDSSRAVAFNNVVTAWPEIIQESSQPQPWHLEGMGVVASRA